MLLMLVKSFSLHEQNDYYKLVEVGVMVHLMFVGHILVHIMIVGQQKL